MVIEIRQMNYFGTCSTCDRIIPQGSNYLYTHGIGECYYYCKYCSIGKYGHTLEDFESFRPEADILSFDRDQYNPWEKLKIDLDMLK